MANKLTVYQKKLLKLISGGVLYTVAMIICSVLLGFFAGNDYSKIPYFLMIVMILAALIYVYRFFVAKKKAKLLYIRYSTLVTLFITLAVFAALAGQNPILYHVVGIGYGVGIIIDRVFSVLHKTKARKMVLAVIGIAYALLLIFLFSFPISGDDRMVVYGMIPLTLIIVSFVDAMKLVFSGLRKQTLIEIIRKTYTIEILYGLITLIVATSILFMTVENCFNNFGDALWYCFAVVTTIGFGDFVATTFIGRILTVMLGIYGIIVVALFTSIIVNFYNATNNKESEKRIEQAVKELEKEKKEYDEDNKDSLEEKVENPNKKEDK